MSGEAQTKNMRFGLKMGPSFDWASSGSTVVNNYGLRLGYGAGLVVDRYFSDQIAVSSGLELNYLRMRYEFTDHRRVEDFLEETDVVVMRKIKATNLEIPIKIKVCREVMDIFKAYVEAGVGLGVNLQDRGMDSYDFYWVSYEGDSYVDCTDQYRLLQVSMVFGLGAEYEINRNLSLFAQLKFDHAFSNAFNSSFEKQTGSVLRNNFFGIEVGALY